MDDQAVAEQGGEVGPFLGRRGADGHCLHSVLLRLHTSSKPEGWRADHQIGNAQAFPDSEML